MKKILLLLAIFTSMYLHAKDVHRISDLRMDDTFSLTISVPINNVKQTSIWDFENGHKIDVDFKVLATKGDSIQLAAKPTRLLSIITKTDVRSYFDSNYLSYYDNKSMFYLFEDNSVVATINAKDGGTNIAYRDGVTDGIGILEEEHRTNRFRNSWYNQLVNIPSGVKLINTNHYESTEDILLDFDNILKLALKNLTQEWNTTAEKGLTMPCMLDLRTKYNHKENSPSFLQLTKHHSIYNQMF